MKVSAIIPVFNVEKYIIRCLDSVAHQTWQGEIECIIVDDCGKDNSVTLIEEYIKGNHSSVDFKIIHHEHNMGLSCARNTGIKEAIGDYLYFLDGDDAITHDCLNILVNLAEKYPKADFVQGNLLDNDLKKSKYAFCDDVPEYSDTTEELESLMLSKLITSAWNRLLKRTFILQYDLFFPIGIVHEDMNWIYFLSRHAKAAAFTTQTKAVS